MEEELRILQACKASRSRYLYPLAVLALNTGMRREETRLLKWKQVDFVARSVTVGKSKTPSGTVRVIPLNDRALTALTAWAQQFPDRLPSHHVFPSEKYSYSTKRHRTVIYDHDPNKPLGDYKISCYKAKKIADVNFRFHDLRHTFGTRMMEAGVPIPVISTLMGWSASTTAQMMKRYGHISPRACQDAVNAVKSVRIHKPTTSIRYRPVSLPLTSCYEGIKGRGEGEDRKGEEEKAGQSQNLRLFAIRGRLGQDKSHFLEFPRGSS